MEPATSVATITSILKLTEKVLEIKAVDAQANSLLETVNEINGQLDAARRLRRQKSVLLSAVEKQLIDGIFESTEKTLSNIAGLVEPCRVELKTNNGDVELDTPLMFVLRDSPHIPITRSQLGIASQGLQTALNILCTREAVQNAVLASAGSDMKAPPSYEESQFLAASRARNMLRRSRRIMPPTSGQSHNPRATFGRLEERGLGSEDQIDFAATTSSPKSETDQLFFDQSVSQISYMSPPGGFRPYRPGSTSSDSAALHSGHNLPTSLLPGPLLENAAGGCDEANLRVHDFSDPIPSSATFLANTKDATSIQDADSPAPSVVDGLREAGRNIQHVSVGAATDPERWSAPPTFLRIDVAIPNPEISIPDLEHTSSSTPTSPTLKPAKIEQLLMPTLQDVSSQPFPTQVPASPTSKQPISPKSSPPILPASKSPVFVKPKLIQIEHRKRRDWESLPSQTSRSAGSPPTFVFQCDSPGMAPEPLFHSMVKLEADKEEPENVQRIPVNLVRRSMPERSIKAALESEFPEVVTADTLPAGASKARLDSEFPELAPRLRPDSAPEPVSLVTEVSTDMMVRTRRKRELEAKLLRRPERAPEVVPGSIPEPVPPVRRPMDNPPDRNARQPPYNRQSAASSTVSLVPSITQSTTETNLIGSGSTPLSGRARSQRWRELQFERSQQLPNST